MVVAGLLVVAGMPAALRADATFDSGTTTISSGTDFGTNLTVGMSSRATLNLDGGGVTNQWGYVGFGAGSVGVVTITGGT